MGGGGTVGGECEFDGFGGDILGGDGGGELGIGRGVVVNYVGRAGGFAVGSVGSGGGGDDGVEAGEFRELDGWPHSNPM